MDNAINEYQRLRAGLLRDHKPEALAVAAMLASFVGTLPAKDAAPTAPHMQTLWACIKAEMRRVPFSKRELDGALAALKQANTTAAILARLDDNEPALPMLPAPLKRRVARPSTPPT
jgi:hypothetical protein